MPIALAVPLDLPDVRVLANRMLVEGTASQGRRGVSAGPTKGRDGSTSPRAARAGGCQNWV